MKNLNIAVLYGSYRSARKGIRAARFAVNKFSTLCSVDLVDAMEYDLPLLDKMYKEYPEGEAPDNLEEIAGILNRADAFVVVTGEYNHGLQAGLKNLLDHFQREFFFKPAGIISYSAGSFGGVRASTHLRVVLGELGMVSIGTILPIPAISKTLDEDGSSQDERITKNFEKFAEELLWYAGVLKEGRKDSTPY